MRVGTKSMEANCTEAGQHAAERPVRLWFAADGGTRSGS